MVAIAALCALMMVMGCGKANAPGEIATACVKATNCGEYDKAMQYCTGDVQKQLMLAKGFADADAGFREKNLDPTLKVVIKETRIAKDGESAEVTLETSGGKKDTAKTLTAELEKTDGVWKVRSME